VDRDGAAQDRAIARGGGRHRVGRLPRDPPFHVAEREREAARVRRGDHQLELGRRARGRTSRRIGDRIGE